MAAVELLQICMCANRMKLLKPDYFYSPQSSWTAVVTVTQGGTMREGDRHDRKTSRKQVRPSEMVAILEIRSKNFQTLAAFV